MKHLVLIGAVAALSLGSAALAGNHSQTGLEKAASASAGAPKGEPVSHAGAASGSEFGGMAADAQGGNSHAAGGSGQDCPSGEGSDSNPLCDGE